MICWSVFSSERKPIYLVSVCEVRVNNMYLRFKSGKTICFSTKKSGEMLCFLPKVKTFFSCQAVETLFYDIAMRFVLLSQSFLIFLLLNTFPSLRLPVLTLS